MKVWAAFGRKDDDEPWRLQTFSVLSAERARALIEREQMRSNLGSMHVFVREYDELAAVPWIIDGTGENTAGG